MCLDYSFNHISYHFPFLLFSLLCSVYSPSIRVGVVGRWLGVVVHASRVKCAVVRANGAAADEANIRVPYA